MNEPTRHVVVRYRVKPECVAAHEALIANVFSELEAKAVTGIAYRVLKLEDGLSFLHLADVSVAENPLPKLAAFREFVKDIGARCTELPISADAHELHGHAGG